MPETETIWTHFRDEQWNIKKHELKELSIDPNKQWGQITLEELETLACHWDMRVSDIVD